MMTISKKVVLLGHFGVGKSSLMRRFVKNEFADDYKVTIGVHILKKEIDVLQDERINLILWDLEGTDDVRLARESYLLGTHGFVFVFDVSRPSTFQNIRSEIKFLEEKYPQTALKIIGNKIDLVNVGEMKGILKENEINYDFLTSAKTGYKVDEMFGDFAKDLMSYVR